MPFTSDGTYYEDKTKPPAENPPTTSGSTGSRGTGGADNGDDGKMSKDEQESIRKAVLWAYQQSYEGKAPPIPKGLLAAALKYRFTDQTSVLDWLRKNARGRYQATTFAKGRANEVNSLLDSIFGEGFKAKAGFIEKYVMGDAEVWSMEKYLEKVVVKSKAFLNLMGGADVWKGFAGEGRLEAEVHRVARG